MSQIEFHVMLEGAYSRVPYAGRRSSNYIDLPSAHFDRLDGQRVIEDQMNTVRVLESLGYDGVAVSEQHNGPIGLMGNPLVAGGYMAALTSKLRINIVGPLVNAYQSPIRLAEEIALLDNLSRGRLTVGLPLGHGGQYHSMGVVNPVTARRRLREAHDLMVRAFESDEVFEWQGEFFQIPYVNLWPKPSQTPYPPFAITGGGSQETLELAAQYRYPYQAVLAPRPALLKTLEKFRNICAEHGYQPDPQQIVTVASVHVAETDAQARKEAEASILWEYQNFFRTPRSDSFPPGYVSASSLRASLNGGYRSKPMSHLSMDEVIGNGWAFVGSPETVASQLAEAMEERGSGKLIVSMNNGSKPTWLANKHLHLFAEEVLPRFRPERNGRPVWETDGAQGAYRSVAEYGARRNRDTPPPTAAIDGALRNVSTAHIDDLRHPLEPWDLTASANTE